MNNTLPPTGSARQQAEQIFWHRVLNAADTIDFDTPCAAVHAQLLALEEGFLDQLDPTDAFQAYVTAKLCQALRRHLEKAADAGT